MDNQKDLLILDGNCGLCHRLANFLDKRLLNKSSMIYLARESLDAEAVLARIPKSKQLADTVYLRKNGLFFIRSAAAIRCLLYLKWYWRMFFPFLWMVPLPLRDLIYMIIAKYRHKVFEKPKVCTFRVD